MRLFPFVLTLLLSCIVCAQLSAQTSPHVQPANPDHTIDSLRLELRAEHPDSIRITILYKLAGLIYHENTTEALTYAKEASTLSDRTNDQLKKAKLLVLMAHIYWQTSDHVKVNFSFLQAIRLFESLRKQSDKPEQYNEDISRCYNGVGLCYTMMKQYDKAEKYFIESIKYETPNTGRALANMGAIFGTQGNHEKALFYFQQAFAASGYSAGLTCNNIGDTYIKLNKPDSAEKYLKQALILSQHKIYPYVTSCVTLGELYLKQKRYSAAETYLFKAKNLAETSGLNQLYIPIYENIVQMYVQQQDFARAYRYQAQLYSLKKAEIDSTVAKQVSEMQAKYETDKKDQEIEISRTKAEKEQLLRNLIIAVAIAVFVIGVVVSRNIVLKQRVRNKLLKEKNMLAQHDIIKLMRENSEAKYEILKGKTNPHFLFNSLNVLSSIIHNEPQLAIEYVERFSAFYRMILKTGDNALISLHEEMQIANNYLYLQRMRFEDNLIVHTTLPVDQHTVFVPSLAIQMLVENAIKHNTITGSRKLYITIECNDQFITVRNNLQKRHGAVPSTATGIRSITDRYALLTQAKPTFIETETTYTVTLPLLTSKHHVSYKPVT